MQTSKTLWNSYCISFSWWRVVGYMPNPHATASPLPVRNSLFNIFISTSHIWRSSQPPPYLQPEVRADHALVKGPTQMSLVRYTTTETFLICVILCCAHVSLFIASLQLPDTVVLWVTQFPHIQEAPNIQTVFCNILWFLLENAEIL
jgi:hypothetical protein